MTVGSPRTWLTTDSLSSTLLNGEIRDQFAALLSPPRARVYRSTNVTLTSATWGLVTFDNTVYDQSYTGVLTTSPNDRLIAPVSGLYSINASVALNKGTTSSHFRGLMLRKNAAGNSASGTEVALAWMYPNMRAGTDSTGSLPSNHGTTIVHLSIEYPLAANDYIQMWAQSNDSGTNTGYGGSHLTWLEMRWECNIPTLL